MNRQLNFVTTGGIRLGMGENLSASAQESRLVGLDRVLFSRRLVGFLPLCLRERRSTSISRLGKLDWKS